MTLLKNRAACEAIQETGKRLAHIFQVLMSTSLVGLSTMEVDQKIKVLLHKSNLISQALGYKNFPGASCLSVNSEIVHGIPKKTTIIKPGDLLKVDICASYKGYCADMARSYSIESSLHDAIIEKGNEALQAGIDMCYVGKYIGDIGNAIEKAIEKYNYGVVKTFCGHGIGKNMHEEPAVPNYGIPGTGVKLRHGMALAIEPMFALGSAELVIDKDKWTARTKDGSLALHVEDTVIITDNGPIIATQIH